MLRKYRHGTLFYLRSRWILDRNITSIGIETEHTSPGFPKIRWNPDTNYAKAPDDYNVIFHFFVFKFRRRNILVVKFQRVTSKKLPDICYSKIFPLVLFLLWRSKGNILFWITGLFVNRKIGFCLFRSLLFLLLLPQQQLLPLWGFKLSYHQSVYPYIIPAEAAGGWLFRILI